MNLDGINVFVRVVQAGSFTAAAKLLGMPVTTVSGKVAQLEKRLGVTLIQRTTRKLHVTEAGEVFFNRCLRAIEEMASAERELEVGKREPEGLLRLTVTVDVGHTLMPPIVQGYLKAHPKMKVELVVTNRRVDLIDEGIDLAIRIGAMPDSTLISKKFLEASAGLWASSSYLRRFGLPTEINELKKHPTIIFSQHVNGLKLTNNKESVDLILSSRVITDDMETIKSFVMQGDGIGVIPDFICSAEEKSGKLIRVLPSWRWSKVVLNFVYPAQRFVPPKVQSFIHYAQKI
jgi:DNA-binding transcriptional LysR family regulator